VIHYRDFFENVAFIAGLPRDGSDLIGVRFSAVIISLYLFGIFVIVVRAYREGAISMPVSLFVVAIRFAPIPAFFWAWITDDGLA
jgi:hypothetical protein